MPFTPDELRDLPDVISAPRFATYLRAAKNDRPAALALYTWNLEASAAFMIPLQICEVAIRNGVVEVLEKVHGPDWPWSNGFLRSLPSIKKGYDPGNDLRMTANRMSTAGKVVAELKFAFWQSLFTAGQDGRLWNLHLKAAFPGVHPAEPISVARAAAFDALFSIRKLRNRIAHHEPIFMRDARADYDLIRRTVSWRSPVAASWMDGIQSVHSLIARKP